MTQKEPIEQYILNELLSESANIEIVKKLLRRLDKEIIIEQFIDTLTQGRTAWEAKIPVSVFSTKRLGALESLVKYLKEELEYSNAKISETLGKSQQAVWTSYNHTQAKRVGRLQARHSQYDIPLSQLKSAKRSILESVVLHLQEKHKLRITQIARLLNRDQRTVWATCKRGKAKR
ncbi:MAG: hypothetical protein V1837_06505 [Candidatus Woesearchaeota archaeon]